MELKMRNQYKILSEKYSAVIESDKEKIMAGINAFEQGPSLKRKQLIDLYINLENALSAYKEAINKLYYDREDESTGYGYAVSVLADEYALSSQAMDGLIPDLQEIEGQIKEMNPNDDFNTDY